MIRDEFGVFALTEILEVVEVVHERFIFKELALRKDYSSDNIHDRAYNSDTVDWQAIAETPNLFQIAAGHSVQPSLR